MSTKILEGSENYTAQVIKLPKKEKVSGLDNLVRVTHQGNDCLISKDSPEDILYLFFPAECELSQEFLSTNNLYRHNHLNLDPTQKGLFEDNGRVRAIKFKGIISTGFVIGIKSLHNLGVTLDVINSLKIGDEFNVIGNGHIVCKKYKIKRTPGKPGNKTKKKQVTIDDIVDKLFAPEHFSTEHLLKNLHRLNLDDYIAVTYKLHGTSARFFNTLVHRKLSFVDRAAKLFGAKIQAMDYDSICASRRSLKSVGWELLPNKNHWYKSGDLWSEVGKKYFEGKLNHGEAVYCEIIGKSFQGEEIQSGYSYGFNEPKVYIYRISNINSQGIEVDLSYLQMKQRAKQLDIPVCPELFYGRFAEFLAFHRINDWEACFLDMKGEYPLERIEKDLNGIFYNSLLGKPSVLDRSVVEEGFCIRKENYPKCEIFKIKSKEFLEFESGQLDKEIVNIEETN